MRSGQGIAVTEYSLSQCISEIRKALRDDGQRILKTIARRGYSLVVPPDTPAHSGPDPVPSIENARPRFSVLIAVLLATFILGATAWWASRPPVPALTREPAIAVLPFADLSLAGDQAHIANGHRIRPDAEPFTASLRDDGSIQRAMDGKSTTGRVWVQGEELCTGWPNTLAACGPVFFDTASERYRHELRFEAFEFRVR